MSSVDASTVCRSSIVICSTTTDTLCCQRLQVRYFTPIL